VQGAVGGPRGECGAQLVPGRRRAVHDRSEYAGVDLGQRLRRTGLVEGARHDVGVRGADGAYTRERDDVRGQPAPDVVEQALLPGARAVDLVDEDERGQAKPPQGLHQHPGLRLHALHGGQQQHRAVEDLQGTLDLRDEVGVPGGVDEVDLDVSGGEGGDGRADGDPALPLDRAVVRTGVAGVDAAEPVDDAGVEEQPLGEAGLTGVDVRQDADVQGVRGVRGVQGTHAWSSPRELSSGGGEGFRGNGAFRAPDIRGSVRSHHGASADGGRN
jgi:hypothetical protein